MNSTRFALAQLRHLYVQMVNGYVADAPQAARGLLGPAIEVLEAFMDDLEGPCAGRPCSCDERRLRMAVQRRCIFLEETIRQLRDELAQGGVQA